MRFAKFIDGLFPLSEVLSDLGEALKLPLGIAQYDGQAVCPKSRAIFASLPTFLLMPAMFDSKPQLKFGCPDINAVLRIQHAKVLPDDFMFVESMQAVCSWIPTANQPSRRHDDDCIIQNRSEQLPEFIATIGRTKLFAVSNRQVV